jgi:hypothetical protein
MKYFISATILSLIALQVSAAPVLAPAIRVAADPPPGKPPHAPGKPPHAAPRQLPVAASDSDIVVFSDSDILAKGKLLARQNDAVLTPVSYLDVLAKGGLLARQEGPVLPVATSSDASDGLRLTSDEVLAKGLLSQDNPIAVSSDSDIVFHQEPVAVSDDLLVSPKIRVARQIIGDDASDGLRLTSDEVLALKALLRQDDPTAVSAKARVARQIIVGDDASDGLRLTATGKALLREEDPKALSSDSDIVIRQEPVQPKEVKGKALLREDAPTAVSSDSDIVIRQEPVQPKEVKGEALLREEDPTAVSSDSNVVFRQ